jgi:hypothetical protein
MDQRTLPAGFIAPCLPTKTDKLPSGRRGALCTDAISCRSGIIFATLVCKSLSERIVVIFT